MDANKSDLKTYFSLSLMSSSITVLLKATKPGWLSAEGLSENYKNLLIIDLK